MFGKIGTMELLVIIGILMIIFGPTQLPKLGRAVGDTIRNFREGATQADEPGKPEAEEP